ncbi:RagB/SusD family nutrient uptake outer membrane protein [Pedobacter mucosus]|uniref:RagB/SusD family nutrient uptake outer membrane protein n=1 Tax=Pedobacter mucosus TaxID=2895286 RepID=UPI001EE4D7B3|nr:RagB/SusD family nutrient uptake outer membrane protein [Pedobacter mucosus]UKT63399.1 RagB/SusD family nutrient uptake outer membrane protein [Pedobacter mucosus]
MKNRYINKKAWVLPLLGLMLFAGSCKKYTDIVPNNTFAEDDAYSNPQRAALAITGVYSAAQSSPYTDGSNRGYPFGAANTIQGDMRGEDMMAIPSFFLVTYENSYDATTANNTALWTSLYATINRANIVIAKLKEAATAGTISVDVATAGEAECRFLRALSYHELLIHFARPYNETAGATHQGVVLRTVGINTPELVDQYKNEGRSTVKQGYDLILADLDFAETNLAVQTTASLRITRATKGAAVALKTRVKLHMGDYAGVITEGAKLGTSVLAATFTSPAALGSFALTATPDGPFASVGANYGNTESIFSIENSTIRNAGTNGSLSTMYSKAPGRALAVISPIIWNDPSWKATDLRRSLLTTTDAATGVAAKYYFTTKYKDPATWTDANPILRYAEVLLNVSEAYARTGNTVQSLALLNAVRNRSVVLTDRYTVANFLTTPSLIQAIINERRIEFLGEGKRWMDIHRLAKEALYGPNGIPAKTSSTLAFSNYNAAAGFTGIRSVAAIPYAGANTSFRFIWPIPTVETQANPVLAGQQNPDY